MVFHDLFLNTYLLLLLGCLRILKKDCIFVGHIKQSIRNDYRRDKKPHRQHLGHLLDGWYQPMNVIQAERVGFPVEQQKSSCLAEDIQHGATDRERHS